jgi:hypothetical protein
MQSHLMPTTLTVGLVPLPLHSTLQVLNTLWLGISLGGLHL